MRRPESVLALAAAFIVAGLAPPALAQETKSARGTVMALAADTLTVKAGAQELRFRVDDETQVVAAGAGTASRQAAAKGKPGLKLGEIIKVGDSVEVSYREMGGALHAREVRRVADPGPGGGMTSDQKAERSNGTVDSITGTALTISGSSGGGGKFTQTFVIDGETKVVAHGASTAAAAAGGKVSVVDLVEVGDRVAVTYHKLTRTLHADEIRVMGKGKPKSR